MGFLNNEIYLIAITFIAFGSAAAIEKGERYGASSSLGMTMNGLFTALLTPFILQSIGII